MDVKHSKIITITLSENDIEDLIEALDEQATAFLKRVKEFKDSADGVA
jgi:hypothetical protein